MLFQSGFTLLIAGGGAAIEIVIFFAGTLNIAGSCRLSRFSQGAK